MLQTLTERRSGFVLTARMPDSSADEVANACIGLLSEQPRRVYTFTSDNGGEFAGHCEIARRLPAQFYFTDPHSPWQRGTNEPPMAC
jgi:IS30 family transposase